MATKSNRSSGSQHNAKGVTQGVTVVGPQSGLPIAEIVDSNGIRRIAVDGNFTAQNVQATVELAFEEDSVAIGDADTGNRLRIENDGSVNANVEVDAADGDNIAISDGNNTAAVNINSQLEVHDTDAIVELDKINNAYERLIPLLANANFLKIANYDSVTPSVVGNIISLSYYEDGFEIAKVSLDYTTKFNWDLDIERYLLDDDGSKLLDDDDTFLFLE